MSEETVHLIVLWFIGLVSGFMIQAGVRAYLASRKPWPSSVVEAVQYLADCERKAKRRKR